jgi:hypothetical protein
MLFCNLACLQQQQQQQTCCASHLYSEYAGCGSYAGTAQKACFAASQASKQLLQQHAQISHCCCQ